jgi:hypothetical protein
VFNGTLVKWLAGVAGAVVVAFLTALVTQWATDKTPDVVVRQYYNTIEQAAAVPDRIGELTLDYQQPQGDRQSAYLIEIANNGRASEEDLRVQVQFPPQMNPIFFREPDLRVYQPEDVGLNDDGFFMALKSFPSGALASVSFVPPDDGRLLCRVQLKAAGKHKEGRIAPIEGIRCDEP